MAGPGADMHWLKGIASAEGCSPAESCSSAARIARDGRSDLAPASDRHGRTIDQRLQRLLPLNLLARHGDDKLARAAPECRNRWKSR
jgi:hypothetical protein